MMKITHYENVTIDSSIQTLTENELNIIISAVQYEQQIMQECTHMINDTQNKIEQIKINAYNEGLEQLHTEQLEMSSQLENKINQLFNKFSTNLHQIIFKVMTKLGFNSNNLKLDKVEMIINETIGQQVYNKKAITLTVHENSLKELKQTFQDQSIVYKIDNNLQLDECIFETDIYLFRIKLTNAYTKISDILAYSHT